MRQSRRTDRSQVRQSEDLSTLWPIPPDEKTRHQLHEFRDGVLGLAYQNRSPAASGQSAGHGEHGAAELQPNVSPRLSAAARTAGQITNCRGGTGSAAAEPGRRRSQHQFPETLARKQENWQLLSRAFFRGLFELCHIEIRT